jgi:hypothetical protein
MSNAYWQDWPQDAKRYRELKRERVVELLRIADELRAEIRRRDVVIEDLCSAIEVATSALGHATSALGVLRETLRRVRAGRAT